MRNVRVAIAAWLALGLALTAEAGAQTRAPGAEAAKAAEAPATGPADVKCIEPLAECTRTRVTQLRTLARGLGNAAATKPTEKLEPEQKDQLERFDKWLRTTRADALRLATMGEKAKGEGTQRAFNLQYLALQDAVRNESRRHAAVAAAAKKKHDLALNAVRNMK